MLLTSRHLTSDLDSRFSIAGAGVDAGVKACADVGVGGVGAERSSLTRETAEGRGWGLRLGAGGGGGCVYV